MKEVEQANDKIILFIDELHVMVGAGGSDGAIDASNILKPSLARGKLRCLGATTTDEYAKYVEKDPALARRFQSVYIPEPSTVHTIEILQGLREKYETHHHVLVPDDAIEVAVQLTGRYLSAKKFPDKAIDLLDECMSKIRNRRERKPTELVEVEKELNALLCETEQMTALGALGGDLSVPVRPTNLAVAECIEFCNKVVDSDPATAVTSSVKSTTERIQELTVRRDQLMTAWTTRNTTIASIFETRGILESCIDQLKTQRKTNVVDMDGFLKRRIEQKDRELTQLCETLVNVRINSSSDSSAVVLPTSLSLPGSPQRCAHNEALVVTAMRIAGNVVDEAELAAVISQSTGIPVSSMVGDSEKVERFTIHSLVLLY